MVLNVHLGSPGSGFIGCSLKSFLNRTSVLN